MTGELDNLLKDKLITGDVAKNLPNSILLPLLTCGNETWTGSEGDASGIRAGAVTLLTMSAGVRRVQGLCNI